MKGTEVDMVSIVVTLMLIALATVCLCAPDRWDAWVWRVSQRHPVIGFLFWGVAWPLALFVLLLLVA